MAYLETSVSNHPLLGYIDDNTAPLCARFRQEISAAKSAKNESVQSTTSGMSLFRSG